MRSIRNEHRRRNRPCALDSQRQSMSRPISLDLHTYSHQDRLLFKQSHLASNKENRLYCLPPAQMRGRHRQCLDSDESRGRLYEPVDLDVLSSVSSLSDELLREADSVEFGQGPILDADYSPTAAMVDGTERWKWRGESRRISIYSTSDLTTSDSEIQCLQQNNWRRPSGKQHSTRNNDSYEVARARSRSPNLKGNLQTLRRLDS